MADKRRVYIRLHRDFSLQWRHLNEQKMTSGHCVDISTTGMGLLTAIYLAPEEIIHLEFQLPGFFKKINMQARVLWHRAASSAKTQYPYLAGVEFVASPPDVVQLIEKFILKSLSLKSLRLMALILGSVIFLMTFLRAFNLMILENFMGTPFGREWLSLQWTGVSLNIYTILHIILAFGILISATAVFFLELKAYRGLIIFTYLGIILQLFRLIYKINFLSSDGLSSSIYYLEMLLLVIFLLLLLILVKNRLWVASVLGDLESYLSVKE